MYSTERLVEGMLTALNLHVRCLPCLLSFAERQGFALQSTNHPSRSELMSMALNTGTGILLIHPEVLMSMIWTQEHAYSSGYTEVVLMSMVLDTGTRGQRLILFCGFCHRNTKTN